MAEDTISFAAAKKQRRRRLCTGGGGDMMSALPDHVLQEVLSSRVTVKDLFMLAATCRRWRARFTDRTFLRELLCPAAQEGQEGLLGFFLKDDASAACSFLPAPGRRSSGLIDAGTMADLVADVPLASRRGILLMQRVPRRSHDTRLLLGVCNPVTGQRHRLAPLETNPADMCCYAIITAADANNAAVGAGAGRYAFSQLLVAAVEVSTSDWAVHVHSYSAATCSWSAPATLDLVDGRRFSLVGRSPVVQHGAAHWLWRGDDGSLYKLSVPLGGAGCVCFASFTRIPVCGGGGNPPPLLCVTGDDNLAAVPYEMDLVDFFMHQLGGPRSSG